MAAPFTLRLVGLALTLAAAVALLGLGDGRPRAPRLVATAAGDVRLDNSRDGAAVLSADALAPGQSASGTVRLTNASGGPLALSLTMTSLADEPGEGGGVLSDHLVLRVDRLTAGGPVAEWSGPLADLPELDLGTLVAGGTRDFRLTATLPEHGPAVDDRFAGGSIDVGYRWTGLGDAEPPAEPVEKGDPPAPAPAPAPAAPAQEEREEHELKSDGPAPWLAAPGPDDQEGPRSARGATVRLWVGGRASQRLGAGLAVSAACRPGCAVQATARVRVGRRWRSLGRRSLGAVAAGAQPGAVRFALTAAQRRALRAALRGRRGLVVQIAVTAAAPGHKSVTKVRSLRLRA